MYAALAYYWTHPAEIAAEIDDEERLVAELKAKPTLRTEAPV